MDVYELASMLAQRTYTEKFCAVCGKALKLEELDDAAKERKIVLCPLHEKLSLEQTIEAGENPQQ